MTWAAARPPESRSGVAREQAAAVGVGVPTRWATTMRSLLVAASAQEATSQGSGQELDCTTRALSSPSSSFSRALRATNSGSASRSRGAGGQRAAAGLSRARVSRIRARLANLGRQGHGQPPGVEQPGERGRGGAGPRYGASGLMLQTSGRERARNQVAPLLEPPSDDTPAEGSLSRCQEIEPTGVLRGYHALVEPAAIGLAVEVLGLHQSHQGRRCVLRRLRQGGRGNAEVVQAERPYGIPATCCACSPPL